MKKFLFVVLLFPLCVFSQQYEIKILTHEKNTSMRGLSVVSDEVAWVSGSNGYIGKTTDGGKSWTWTQPKGYEKLDFRDIEAFDAQEALIVNAGSPAYILLTQDGGQSWKEVYKNTDSLIFLDGMAFWNRKEGIIFGDPIDNRMQLLKTDDGGMHWHNISNNLKHTLAVGEAGFAASGTSIRTHANGSVWIATGGTVSNVYYSSNKGKTWKIYRCPILQGESSTGPFSIGFANAKEGIAVGGNYLKDRERKNNIVLTYDGGKTWAKPQIPVWGYRSAVEHIEGAFWVATGSSGTDFSIDKGQTWINLSTLNFNAIQKAKAGKLILLTGNRGQIAQLVPVQP